MFGGHLQPAGGVVQDHLAQVGPAVRAVEEVVADAAADKGLLDPLDLADAAVELEQPPVAVVEVGAGFRVEARGTRAAFAAGAVAAAHAVHVGRGAADVGEVAPEILHAGDFLHLGEDRTLAARGDELALVGRYGAEAASAEASPVEIDRVFDHLIGGNRPPVAVAGVGQAGVGQIETVVDLGFGQCRIGGRDHNPPVARALHERGLLPQPVALHLDVDEVFGEGRLVGHALLVGVQAEGVGRIEPVHVVVVGHEGHLGQLAQQLGVESVAHGAGHVDDRLVAHAVHEQVGPAVDQYRGVERVAPVVVVGQSAQRCLDAADHDGRVRVERLEDARIDGHRAVGAESGLAAGRVGVVAAQAEVGRVVVHHRIHAAGRDAEEEARFAQFAEVAQVVAPVGLRHDGHAVAFGLQQPADDRRSEGGVIDVGIAGEQDDVEVVPAECFHLFGRGREPVARVVGSHCRGGCGYATPAVGGSGRRALKFWNQMMKSQCLMRSSLMGLPRWFR